MARRIANWSLVILVSHNVYLVRGHSSHLGFVQGTKGRIDNAVEIMLDGTSLRPWTQKNQALVDDKNNFRTTQRAISLTASGSQLRENPIESRPLVRRDVLFANMVQQNPEIYIPPAQQPPFDPEPEAAPPFDPEPAAAPQEDTSESDTTAAPQAPLQSNSPSDANISGVAICEGRGFNEVQCNFIGCCKYDFDLKYCRSGVGNRACQAEISTLAQERLDMSKGTVGTFAERDENRQQNQEQPDLLKPGMTATDKEVIDRAARAATEEQDREAEEAYKKDLKQEKDDPNTITMNKVVLIVIITVSNLLAIGAIISIVVVVYFYSANEKVSTLVEEQPPDTNEPDEVEEEVVAEEEEEEVLEGKRSQGSVASSTRADEPVDVQPSPRGSRASPRGSRASSVHSDVDRRAKLG